MSNLQSIAWGRFAVFSSLIMGTGYCFMKFTTPSEQQLYDSLSPELKKRVDDTRAGKRAQSNMQAKVEKATKEGAQGPVWAD